MTIDGVEWREVDLNMRWNSVSEISPSSFPLNTNLNKCSECVILIAAIFFFFIFSMRQTEGNRRCTFWIKDDATGLPRQKYSSNRHIRA